MNAYLLRFTLIFPLVLLLCGSCTRKKNAALVWDKNLYTIGSQSSPRAADLNGDGRDEVIIRINENDCTRDLTDHSSFEMENKLLVP